MVMKKVVHATTTDVSTGSSVVTVVVFGSTTVRDGFKMDSKPAVLLFVHIAVSNLVLSAVTHV